MIDWQKEAAVLEREIRAYAEWPKSRTAFGSVDVIITKAHTLLEATSGEPGTISIIDKRLAVHCGRDMLVIDSLKPAGKKEMTGEAFLAGYKSQIGL